MVQNKKYILTLDQGTTSSRAILFDHKGQIADVAQKTFQQIYPYPGWVEHDPNEIFSSQASVAAEVMSKSGVSGVDDSQLAAIGITNQRETTIIWDRKTGIPIYNAIVWQDRRTASFCNELKNQGMAPFIQAKTGLILDAYFSASKIKWILDHVQGAREKAEKGELCFGTVDAWLIYKLTNGKRHVTDISNASRTMLFDIHRCDWDDELLAMFDVPKAMLPEVKASSEILANTSDRTFPSMTPIAGVAGDQQAALFGQMCVEEGMLKTTYGTGCFMVTNTGSQPLISHNQLLSTIAWQIDGKVTYALEGSVFMGGAIIQWLRDALRFFRDSGDSEALARSVEDNGGVYLVPAMAGLGAPYWDQSARGVITGLTRGSSKAHITRAALESICYQVNDIAEAMAKDSSMSITEMRVDGGAIANDFLMQFQSDIMQTTEVVRPGILETTALGAAYLAGLAVGFWDNIDQLKQMWSCNRRFKPTMSAQESSELIHNWTKAVERSKGWASEA